MKIKINSKSVFSKMFQKKNRQKVHNCLQLKIKVYLMPLHILRQFKCQKKRLKSCRSLKKNLLRYVKIRIALNLIRGIVMEEYHMIFIKNIKTNSFLNLKIISCIAEWRYTYYKCRFSPYRHCY